ncbi:hypothetical protein [Planktotalea sp.]|uniref:hypothetical protein n=1 Tax=Planktotalea sp. TaxID=2029877 RepID=UPI003299900D
MSTFLTNVPVWVLPLFILLVSLGWRASKDRTVPLFLIYLLPLLGLITASNLYALAPKPVIWAIATLAYGIGVFMGMTLQRRWTLSRGARIVQVKGEWVTLTAMMIIFAAGFVNGTVSAIAPDITGTMLYLALFAGVACLPSGHFLGRAITIAQTPLTKGV